MGWSRPQDEDRLAAGMTGDATGRPALGGGGMPSGRDGAGGGCCRASWLAWLVGQVRNDSRWRRLNASAISVAHGHVLSMRRMRRRPVLTRRPAACQRQ